MTERPLLDALWMSLSAVGPFLGLLLMADNMLRRRIKLRTIGAWFGFKTTLQHPVDPGRRPNMTMIPNKLWWKCALPWPGKAKWAETVLAKAALLGATFEYVAVSAFDWDEAWVIKLDEDNIIASSNKTATALAYLKHMGVEQ